MLTCICRKKAYEMSRMRQREKLKAGFAKGSKDCGYNYTVELKSAAKPDSMKNRRSGCVLKVWASVQSEDCQV
ncbi:hypothetical protein Barb4_02776 [Bacteroidales bacterium Barb4]|nr:hypothetical protein Barb4_02776 [Bacteroidales bacterium Barb4]